MPINIELDFRFKAVLWDMDGTLIDSEPIWIEEERKLMLALGGVWSEADAIHCIGGPMERVDQFMRTKLSPDVLSQYAPLALTEILRERMTERLSQGVNYTRGSLSLLTELHGLKVPQALVSASSRPIMDAALSSIGSHFFSTTISDNDVSSSKPHPEGYLLAAQRIGVSIEDCLILEDSVTGITAAIDLGAYVLGLPHFADLPLGDRVLHRDSLEGLSASAVHELFAAIDR